MKSIVLFVGDNARTIKRWLFPMLVVGIGLFFTGLNVIYATVFNLALLIAVAMLAYMLIAYPHYKYYSKEFLRIKAGVIGHGVMGEDKLIKLLRSYEYYARKPLPLNSDWNTISLVAKKPKLAEHYYSDNFHVVWLLPDGNIAIYFTRRKIITEKTIQFKII